MKLCITEKPSVGRDIAKILKADHQHEGYIEGNGYCVTWTFGHLCTLKEPADYTERWSRWSISSLPMIPQKFGIKLIKERGIERQFNVIKDLAAKAECIINCGDAGQEGELIQRWVMLKAGVKCPVYRLWISSMTDEAIINGFKDLKPESDYTNLYYAGMSRAIGDWVLGLNATRLYTLKYSAGNGNLLSVGRVQTPTLAMIVERQRAIQNFVSEPFWELKTKFRDVDFMSVNGRFKTVEEAKQVLDSIAGMTFTVKDISEKKARESAPRLFDLTSLQVETNRLWGWTADKTLKLIQSLYEKKVTTYPRVDTTYLPEDVYPKIPGILQKMTPYAKLTEKVLAGRIAKNKKIFDNSKITDHHAIIPTGEYPGRLVDDERLLYHLIATRFIAVFYPDCVFNVTTVLGDVDGHGFKANGKVIVDAGWRDVYRDDRVLGAQRKAADIEDKKNKGEEQDKVLPPFTVGESGEHSPELVQKSTQPPKPYTEGTLLRAMETAGRQVDDEELREAMKENGIGRPSTRSAIIETLFRRGYIKRTRKAIIATDAGCALIDTIKDDLIKSPKLTGLWENKLRRIELGQYSAGAFMTELKELVRQVVMNVLNDYSGTRIVTKAVAAGSKTTKSDSADSSTRKGTSDTGEDKPKAKRKPAVKSLEQITCPVCGKGHIIKGKTAYGCSEYRNGCSLRLMFDKYSADLTPSKLNTLIKKEFKIKD